MDAERTRSIDVPKSCRSLVGLLRRQCPYATFENMEEIGIFKVSKSQWTDEVTLKGDTQFSKPALKYRLVQVKSKLPDIIAAVLAEYSYTDLHTYLLDLSPAGFT